MNSPFQIPLVVSYYTQDTVYEKQVQRLLESCKKWDIEHHVEAVKDQGSWEKNCAYKPYFLREKLKAFQRPLLWVDADEVFLRAFPFEEFMFADLAVFYNPISSDPCCAASTHTIYVNATQGGYAALDLWCHSSEQIIEQMGSIPAFLDQASLYFVLRSSPSFQIAFLPLTYGKIVGRDAPEIEGMDLILEHTVISHTKDKEKIC